MKKFIPIACIILFLALPIFSNAHENPVKGKYTKEKTIKKEFEVSANALMSIDNSYGNLNITSWNENRIMIEVRIKTNGNNEDKVQKKLDEISVNFEAGTDMVSAKTIFNQNNNNWNWNWGGGNNVNMQIDYFIKVPVKNNIHLNNDYGSIILDRIDGHAKINCDYGRLEIGELRGRNNELNFDYTSKSSIGYINSGRISADYSGFTIDKAGDLVIKADYTNSTVQKMDNLEYSSDYGSIDIGEAKNIKGSGDYINVKLGVIHGNIDISADYGSLKIKELAEDAGNVQIKSDYMGIHIGYNPLYYFDFEITAEYAGVSGKENFEINVSTEKSNQKYYKGYYGKNNSGNKISVNSDYGSISFNKN